MLAVPGSPATEHYIGISRYVNETFRDGASCLVAVPPSIDPRDTCPDPAAPDTLHPSLADHPTPREDSMAKARKNATSTRTAALVAKAIASAKKAAGKAGEDMDVHVHVGDVVLMGFDEAVDAEEWNARETNHEVAGGKGRGRRAARESDPQDEQNRKVSRSITFRKGGLRLDAVERSQPTRRKKAAPKPAKKAAKKAQTKAAKKKPVAKAGRRRGRR